MTEKEPKTTTITQLVESGNKVALKNVANDNAQDVVESKDGPESKSTNKLDHKLGQKNAVELLGRLREKNMLVPGSAITREIQDDYRRVKRPLVSNACGRNKAMVENGNIILVTSSVPGEGKTYTSVNLALSIAQEIDSTVLLIDCDVAKQGVSRMLGIESYPGLVDVLEADDNNVSEVMLKTDIPNLRLISAGKQSDYVTELLASNRMASLVSELVSRYSDRIIILDGPPLLPTPQTQILVELVGQVVFVIEGGKTPQALVEEALSMIPKDQATGLVLNKNVGLSGSGGYYYGYYATEHKREKATS